MKRVTRVSLVALCALAVGSWIGVGRPSASQAKTLVLSGEDKLMEAPRTADLPKSHLPILDFAPSLAPKDIDGMQAWPRMNPEASAKHAWLLAEGPYHADGDNKKIVTLTFDDGPFPETTPSILRLLAKYNLHATFFVIGRYLDGDDQRAKDTRDVLSQIDAAGHLIGNHTHDHELLTVLPRTQELAQIDDGAASIRRVIGKEPLVFRPPYGQVDPFTMQLLRERKQELVLWNVEAEDMKHDDADEMFQSIKSQLEYAGGGVVLLHDIRPSTITVLSMLLEWISLHKYDDQNPERAGWDVVDLPGFLRATSESPQPYRDRIELEHRRAQLSHKKHLHALMLAQPLGEIKKP